MVAIHEEVEYPKLNRVWCPSRAWGACWAMVGVFCGAAGALGIVFCSSLASDSTPPGQDGCQGLPGKLRAKLYNQCLASEAGVRGERDEPLSQEVTGGK